MLARLTVVVQGGAFPAVAADRLTVLIEHAIAERGQAFVSLTGGTTPRATYGACRSVAALAAANRLVACPLFWGDERHVPPDHPDSNFGMADRALIQHVPIPPDHVHRIRGDCPTRVRRQVEYSRTTRSVRRDAARPW